MERSSAIGMVSEAMRKGKYFLLLSAIVSLLVSVMVLFLADKRYTSRASILPSSSGRFDSGVPDGGFNEIGAFMGIRESRSLMSLYPDILRSRLVGACILRRNYCFAEDGVRKTMTLQEYLGCSTEMKALAVLSSRVARFWTDRGTKALVISVTTGNPELSRLVANAYIERLEKFNREERRSSALEVRYFIGRKLEVTSRRVMDAEENLRRFREGNRDYARSTEPGILMEARRLERSLEIEQAIFMVLGRQMRKAEVDAGRDTPILNILDYGTLPDKPSWPVTSYLLFSITLAGTTAGMICLAARESFDRWRRGKNRDAVEGMLLLLREDLGKMPFVKTVSCGRS